jgi:triacylglycerol lipase
MRSLATSLLITIAAAAPVAKRAAPSYIFAGDAPFSVKADTLAAALTCPGGNPTAVAPPVLLVHGTATTGDQSWGKGYVPALRAEGYTPCYVTLPSRAMDDMQVSSEYVAYNLHQLASLSGGLKPAIISHSQGGPVSQWALQFWPSTRSVTRAFIPLSPDFDGVDLAISDLSAVCDLIDCQPSLWQQSQGSNYYKALHAGDFRALVPTTSIWTKVPTYKAS